MRIYYVLITFLLMGLFTTAQQPQEQKYKPIYDNLIPVSPTAFQFAKYTDMPVSEYTGIPNISIPLYTIKQGEFEFPISLSYHAGGIRVSQEASWVGLGWDLTMGSVSQTINDQDDFGSYQGSPNPKVLPDYVQNATPGAFPLRWNYGQYCSGQFDSPTWTSTTTVNTPQANYGFMVATDYYLPVNGSVQRRVELLDYEEYDSEPDIFKANFLGHSVNFIRKFTNNYTEYVVLNKKGYKVQRNGNYDSDSWIITTPDGIQYYFEERVVTKSYSSTWDFWGSGGSTTKPSSKTWMLTKIITKDKDIILISYSRTAEKTQFPYFSQKRYKVTNEQQSMVYPSAIPIGKLSIGFQGLSSDYYGYSYSYTQEESLFPSLIQFTGGKIEFVTSSRSDVDGGIKLDQVKIYSDRKINEFNFSYSYFDASGVSSPGFTVTDNDFNKKRLKLQSITLQDNSTYTFQYNSTILPRKNSFAQDYWGFYNGNLQNQSMVPNAARLNRADLFNNGDNHSASVEYTKAGVLEKVVWPTGGNTQFVYELNEFDNYWVPDYTTTTNTLSHGNGLRVKDIIYATSDGLVSKKTRYTYEGGKAITPKDMIRTFPYSAVNFNSCGEEGTYRLLFATYTLTEVNGQSYYSANSFGSGSAVGYDKVTKYDIGVNDQSLGRTETYYYNYSDRVSTTSNSTVHISVSLPAIKQYDSQKPENGLVKQVKIYDNNGILVRFDNNSYSNTYSEIYYGARIYGYGMLLQPFCHPTCWNTNSNCQCGWSYVSAHLIGYYPIFDFESLLTSSTSKTYTNSQEHVTTTIYSYDQYNQIISTSVQDNGAEMNTYLTRTPDATGTVRDYMVGANRLSDVWAVQKKYYPPSTYPGIIQSEYTSTYKNINGRYVQDIATISENGPILGGNPKTISYDQYDTSANLIQYTASGVSNSFIWDYQNQYPIAKVMNSTVGNVAYTSFEADGTGSWWYAPWKVRYDLAAPTGIKIYDMEGGMWRNDLTPSLTYKLSFWAKEGLPGVNINHPGGTYTIPSNTEFKSIRTINGWTLYELPVSNAEGVGIWKWGHIARTFVDEVRLCPADAQMVTYTYEPLIGMTSQCDANNMIQYYQYDPMNRLQYIKDEKRNMLKMYCYNYNGLPQECDGNGVGNDAMNQTFYRDCGSPYFPGVNYMQVPANMFLATTKTQANQLAQNYINYYGPLITNTNTQCGTAIYAKISYENYHSDMTKEYQDVVIRFYGDAACTQPISVSNLTVNYTESVYMIDTYTDEETTTNTNYSVTVSGDKYVIGYSVVISEINCCMELYRSYFVNTGSGYTPN